MESKLSYKMFDRVMIKYSCFITNEAGDNVAKMLRNDAESNSIQEEWAKDICNRYNNHDVLLSALKDLYNAIDSCTELTPELLQQANTAIKQAEQQ